MVRLLRESIKNPLIISAFSYESTRNKYKMATAIKANFDHVYTV